MRGIAVFHDHGYVRFIQINKHEVSVNGHLKRIPPGKHGFHVHTSGNLLKKDCTSCGGHYNPGNTTHGDRHNGHAGDLGNIVATEKGTSNFRFITRKFTVKEIIGRSIIVHEDEDDLGKGDNEGSLVTGNSGRRMLCAVIGIE